MGFDKCNWGITWNFLKRTIPLDTELLNVTSVQPRTRVDIAAWSRHMAHLWTFATSADSSESNIHVVSLIFNYTQTGCNLDDRHPFSIQHSMDIKIKPAVSQDSTKYESFWYLFVNHRCPITIQIHPIIGFMKHAARYWPFKDIIVLEHSDFGGNLTVKMFTFLFTFHPYIN